jgi:hypothetical protein
METEIGWGGFRGVTTHHYSHHAPRGLNLSGLVLNKTNSIISLILQLFILEKWFLWPCQKLQNVAIRTQGILGVNL